MDFSVSCQFLIGRSLGTFASIIPPGNGLLIGGCLSLGLIRDSPKGASLSAFSGWRFPVCGQRDLSPVCIHFPTEGYLGSLQVLAIMNKAAIYHCVWGFPGGLVVKNLPANARDMGLIPGSGRSPGGGQGNPLQVFPWKSWWTEKPGRLQSVGLQKSCT